MERNREISREKKKENLMESELRALATTAAEGLKPTWGINPKAYPAPSISLQLIVEPNKYNMSGSDILKQTNIQMDVFSSSFAETLRLRNLLVDGLDNYRGNETTSIKNILLDRQRQMNDLSDPKNPVYRQSIDWKIFYV